jgi:hypothetical protein
VRYDLNFIYYVQEVASSMGSFRKTPLYVSKETFKATPFREYLTPAVYLKKIKLDVSKTVTDKYRE